MKKILLIPALLLLSSCAKENMPDSVLKYYSPSAYEQRMAEEKCRTYLENRRIIVEGTVGYYEYNTNENGDFSCYAVGEEMLNPYTKPARYGKNRPDLYLN